MTRTPASGTPITLTSGEYVAEIASVGATLRALRHGGRDLVVPFAADEVRPAYRGGLLAPWPNRVVDGRYTFADEDFQLPLTEPRRGHALHGLAAWLDFTVTEQHADSVALRATIEPQIGYPWRVRIDTIFTLGSDGLSQRVRATNESETRAPYGTGPHPYLVAGTGTVDGWTLVFDAAEVLEVSGDRLAPRGLAPVASDAGRFDFRSAHLIGAAEIDHAFTGFTAREVTVTASEGTGVRMTWGAECPWVQVHTADQPDGAASPFHRIGLAVEPMTCAPDAFNTDRYDYDAGLRVLSPGEEFTASWRIEALG